MDSMTRCPSAEALEFPIVSTKAQLLISTTRSSAFSMTPEIAVYSAVKLLTLKMKQQKLEYAILQMFSSATITAFPQLSRLDSAESSLLEFSQCWVEHERSWLILAETVHAIWACLL